MVPDTLHKPFFSEGDIVIMHITHRWATPEGWAAGGTAGPQQLRFFENIDLNSFPSHNDFKGHSEILTC